MWNIETIGQGVCGADHERTVSAFLPRWNYFEYVRPSLISVKRWGKLHLRRKSVKTDGYIRYGLTVLTTTPHVDLYVTSLLRMRLYLNTPKQDHAYPLSEDVRTLPSDPRSTAPATFLSEDQCEIVKNDSKPSSNASTWRVMKWGVWRSWCQHQNGSRP